MYFLISVPKESCDRGSSGGDSHSDTDGGRAETRPWSQLLLPCGEKGTTSPHLSPVCLVHTSGVGWGGLSVMAFRRQMYCHFSQGDIGAPGAAGPKGEKVIYYCSIVCVWERLLCVRLYSYSVYVYVFRVTLALKGLLDQRASKGKKEKLYEILKCPYFYLLMRREH